MLSLASTSTAVRKEESSCASRIATRSVRANSFQSIRAGSSPCWYGRYSRNSGEAPTRFERCAPCAMPGVWRRAGQ